MESRETFKFAVFEGIKRPGIDKLMNALEATDFYTAPCSTRYHLCVPGGLVQHSLNVYDRLWSLVQANGFNYSRETVAVVSLFHDLCKANTYGVENRWCKVDGQWEQYETYTYAEQFTYGHGEKSVYYLMKYLVLTDEEAQAIRYHMGAWQDGERRSAGNAFKQNNLAVLLHIADMMATYFDEQ